MRRSSRIVSLVLAATVTVSALSACSLFSKKDDGINRYEVTIPEPTEAEQVVNVTAAVSVSYYLTARAYLDELLAYDTSDMSEEEFEEFSALLDNAIYMFDCSEKLSYELTAAAEAWEADNEDFWQAAEMTEIKDESPSFSLGTTVYADKRSPAEQWAQDIVDTYDKAPALQGLKTLADQLGTDSKHAYAQLKQALAILEGAEYTEIADKANAAIQVASTLKTAGTAASLVIAVSAAPAAGTLGAVVKTGGVVCTGINTILEVGSTGSLIYHNGEDNDLSIAFDKTEAQFAPIGQIFSVMGLGYSIRDLGKTGYDILNNGFKSLSTQDIEDLMVNSFGVISYATTAINDYLNDGTVLSGTFKVTDKGTVFTLMDTLTGKSDEDRERITKMLTEAGLDKSDVKDAFDEDEADPPDGNIPEDIANKIIGNNEPFTYGGDFDVVEFWKGLEGLFGNEDPVWIEETEVTETGESEVPEEEPYEEEEPPPSEIETETEIAVDEGNLPTWINGTYMIYESESGAGFKLEVISDTTVQQTQVSLDTAEAGNAVAADFGTYYREYFVDEQGNVFLYEPSEPISWGILTESLKIPYQTDTSVTIQITQSPSELTGAEDGWTVTYYRRDPC